MFLDIESYDEGEVKNIPSEILPEVISQMLDTCDDALKTDGFIICSEGDDLKWGLATGSTVIVTDPEVLNKWIEEFEKEM